MPLILDIEPPPGALVRVISDLHLGHERCELRDWSRLEALLAGVHTLVVAGDLAEGRVCAWRERGQALRDELRERCRSRGVQLVELAGNHDPETEPMLARLWGGRVTIMHGHCLFKVVAPWSWEYLHHKAACRALIARFPDCEHDLRSRLKLARAMSRLTPPVMRREGIRNPLLRGLLHCFWPPQRPLSIILCWLLCGRLAERFARRFFPQTQVLIFGHFHRGLCRRYGQRLICNTGAWFRHASPYYVDLRDGAFVRYRRVPKS